jgi:UDP-glucose 4-epimerase
MAWLVTGGAGYVGAHVVAAMRAAGRDVTVLDDLSTGDRSRIPGVRFVKGSVLDASMVARLLHDLGIRGIVHVAGKKEVAESLAHPLHYYRENVEGMCALLRAATDVGVSSLVFSSSAAVYGEPNVDVVHESTPCRPVNPYGTTKLVCERMIEEVAAATGLRYVNLRYFNVAGAASAELTDRGVTNLVPMVFEQLQHGLPPRIFGDDYPTPDGTCIRDFIHVADIASAHVAAARALEDEQVAALTANIGRGKGVSVRDMVAIIRRITGTADEDWAEPVIEPRRIGDPARVVATADRIQAVLGWQARHGVEEMVASAWGGWVATTLGRRSLVPRPRVEERSAVLAPS